MESREREHYRARGRSREQEGSGENRVQSAKAPWGMAGAAGRAAWGEGEEAWQASAPRLLVSAASQDPLAQKPEPLGSRDDRMEVRAHWREEWVGLGVGAQAGGQSRCCLRPWEDWEAGAESQPRPLWPRITPRQDHLPGLWMYSLGLPVLEGTSCPQLT